MAAPGRRRSAPRAPGPLDDEAARATALDLLSRKSWTARDLKARLRRRGAPDAVAEAVVGELVARGYVDDADFARTWADVRTRIRKIGPLRLKMELAARGVAPALAAAAVEAAFAEVDERARAREAARRSLPALIRRGAPQAPARLRDVLLRLGYSAPVARDVVRDVTGADAGPAEAGV